MWCFGDNRLSKEIRLDSDTCVGIRAFLLQEKWYGKINKQNCETNAFIVVLGTQTDAGWMGENSLIIQRKSQSLEVFPGFKL